MEKHFSVPAAHGLTTENVVKAGVWITGGEHFVLFDKACAQAFGGHCPARSTAISGLAIDGTVVEIDLIASFDSVLA